MFVLHPVATRSFTAWKNGGGETVEIVCQPEGAGFDDFAWRISTARVAASGPFSIFPGVARSLTVLEGGPMVLRIDGREIVATPETGPIGFRGDLPCDADLTGAPVLDLNVMTRAPFSARVYRPGPPAPPPGPRRGIFWRCRICRIAAWRGWTWRRPIPTPRRPTAPGWSSTSCAYDRAPGARGSNSATSWCASPG